MRINGGRSRDFILLTADGRILVSQSPCHLAWRFNLFFNLPNAGAMFIRGSRSPANVSRVSAGSIERKLMLRNDSLMSRQIERPAGQWQMALRWQAWPICNRLRRLKDGNDQECEMTLFLQIMDPNLKHFLLVQRCKRAFTSPDHHLKVVRVPKYSNVS